MSDEFENIYWRDAYDSLRKEVEQKIENIKNSGNESLQFLQQKITELKDQLNGLESIVQRNREEDIKVAKAYTQLELVLTKLVDLEYDIYTLSQQYGKANQFKKLLQELEGEKELNDESFTSKHAYPKMPESIELVVYETIKECDKKIEKLIGEFTTDLRWYYELKFYRLRHITIIHRKERWPQPYIFMNWMLEKWEARLPHPKKN